MLTLRQLSFLLFLSTVCWAQTPSDVAPAAPVPVQISTAKKIFISNAQGESTAMTAFPNQTYNEFYAAMKEWGRYELMAMPADADLILEISFIVVIGPTTIYQGNGTSPQEPEVRLVIFDPKTHVVLWAFTEPIKQAALSINEKKNFKLTLGKLVSDVKGLADLKN
jgi:hypothetical protein